MRPHFIYQLVHDPGIEKRVPTACDNRGVWTKNDIRVRPAVFFENKLLHGLCMTFIHSYLSCMYKQPTCLVCTSNLLVLYVQATYLSCMYKQPTCLVCTSNLLVLYVQATYLSCMYKQPTCLVCTSNLLVLYVQSTYLSLIQ